MRPSHISPEDASLLDAIIEAHGNSYCVSFAVAANRRLGWPCVEIHSDGVPIHMANRLPDGRLFDAHGPSAEVDLLARYSELNAGLVVVDSNEDQVREWGGLMGNDLDDAEIASADHYLGALLLIIDPDGKLVASGISPAKKRGIQ